MKSKLPPPLTGAQVRLLKELTMFRGVICFRKSHSLIHEWRYFLVTPKQTFLIPNTNTVTALIRKGALVPELSDKEFAVQLALGTIDHRVYKQPRNRK